MKKVTILRNSDESGGLRRVLPLAGLALAALVFVGCSSSSSSRRSGGDNGGGFQHESAQFAVEGESSLANRLEGGDDLNLPMHTQGFSADGQSRNLSGNQANFRLRSDGSSVTIETPDRNFEWTGVARAADGTLTASATDEAPFERFLDLDSQYLDYVHFGHWNESQWNTEGEFVGSAGGAFFQGLETRVDDLPGDDTDLNYTGTTIGRGVHATEGEYTFDGTVALDVNFATGNVGGSMNTTINDFTINGTISDNRFSGDVTVSGAGGTSVSFAADETGDLAGRFFGPNAEEAGGTWSIQDNDNVATAGFGASRP